MPKSYIPKPKVECENCHDMFSRTRPSRSGRYYCAKAECQRERQRRYEAERRSSKVTSLEEEHQKRLANTADFLWRALHAPRVTCPDCGCLDAIQGYPHFNFEDGQCSGTGTAIPGITINHALAVWPKHTRRFAEQS